MKSIKLIFLTLLALFSSISLFVQGASTDFEDLFPRLGKGGIGIISKDLYVVTQSTTNEVILRNGKRWSGLSSSKPQVVFVVNGEVVQDPSSNPSFDIAKAVLISFQVSGIYFYNFPNSSGGNYLRAVHSEK